MLENNLRSGWGRRQWPRSSSTAVPTAMPCNGEPCNDRNSWRQEITNIFATIYEATEPQRVTHDNINELSGVENDLFAHDNRDVSFEEISEIIDR